MGMDPPILEGMVRIQHWKMALSPIPCPRARGPQVPFIFLLLIKETSSHTVPYTLPHHQPFSTHPRDPGKQPGRSEAKGRNKR